MGADDPSAAPDDIVAVRKLRTPEALRRRLRALGASLPVVDEPFGASGVAVMAAELPTPAGTAANRWVVLPMEGWDATTDGRPTDLVRRRWRRFGESGAGLVWGGEAVAVVPEGRANPRQLCIGANSTGDLAALRQELVAAHRASGAHGADAPVIGLQLTHSGRWSRPDGTPAPRTAWTNRLLDARCGAAAESVLSDTELDDLVGAFAAAAAVAAEAGFDFVDVKQCHGYLGHDLLSAVDRPGPYGGDLRGRLRFFTSVVDAIGAAAPGLAVGTRLSLFDPGPYRSGPDGRGARDQGADPGGPPPFLFGSDGNGGADLTETHELLDRLRAIGVHMVCATAGSPYYSPHAQRPAFFPPSDGYRPFRDPLVDVAAMQEVTAEVFRRHPELVVIGSGLTYLQDWLPHVATPLVEDGWMSAAGIGRMVLSHPSLPVDALSGRSPDRRLVCRTFSDCTTAPRHGLVSGCYPLDPHYKQLPERAELAAVKRRLRRDGT